MEECTDFSRFVITTQDMILYSYRYLTNVWDIFTLLHFLEQHGDSNFWKHIDFTVMKPSYREPSSRFPINMLRNIGISRAPTNFVLVADADFIPSPTLSRVARDHIVPKIISSTSPTAVVIPCFALSDHYFGRMPASVDDLRSLYRKGSIYVTDPGSGHGPTQYQLFLEPSVFRQSSAFYEVCYESQWEPYYVVAKYFEAPQPELYMDQHRAENLRWEHRDATSSPYETPYRLGILPQYDIRFENQGGDKQQHAAVLNAMGYRFLVSRETYLLHLDHPSGALQEREDGVRNVSVNDPWAWPGGLKRRDQSSSLHTRTFSYFDEFLPELQSRFGHNSRWPRGCSHPLLRGHGGPLLPAAGGF